MLVGMPRQSSSTVFKYLILNVGQHTEPKQIYSSYNTWMLVCTLQPKQLYCSYHTWMLVGTLKPRASTALTMSLSRWRSSKLLSAPFDSNAGFCKTFSNWYLVMIEVRTDMWHDRTNNTSSLMNFIPDWLFSFVSQNVILCSWADSPHTCRLGLCMTDCHFKVDLAHLNTHPCSDLQR